MDQIVQADMNILDNYISDFSFTSENKIFYDEEFNMSTNLGFKVINVEKKEDYILGQIQLEVNVMLKTNQKKEAKINLVINGLFSASLKLEDNEFEELLKVNGASILFGFCRTYISTATTLSNMPHIVLPLVNFVEFFKNAEEVKENKN